MKVSKKKSQESSETEDLKDISNNFINKRGRKVKCPSHLTKYKLCKTPASARYSKK